MRDDEEIRLGRTDAREIRGLKCGRSNGRGERTFHTLWASITRAAGGASRGHAALDYMDRAEAFADREDLEMTGGRSREEMAEIIQALHETATQDRHRVLSTGHVEIDARLSVEGRCLVVERIADTIEADGFAVHWAIHGKPQPHAHLAVGSRPVRRNQEGRWIAEAVGRKGAPGRSFLPNRQAVLAFRRVLADAVNAELDREQVPGDRWHPGSFRDLGIDRAPKTRVPALEYRRRKAAGRSSAAIVNARIEAGESVVVQAERAAWGERQRTESARRRADREARQAEQLRARGLVPAEKAAARERAATEAAETRAQAKIHDTARQLTEYAEDRAKNAENLRDREREKAAKAEAATARSANYAESVLREERHEMLHELPRNWWNDDELASEVWKTVRELRPRAHAKAAQRPQDPRVGAPERIIAVPEKKGFLGRLMGTSAQDRLDITDIVNQARLEAAEEASSRIKALEKQLVAAEKQVEANRLAAMEAARQARKQAIEEMSHKKPAQSKSPSKSQDQSQGR